ncbi:uncharacterized protein LOC135105256 [Scylla paramamosain]|uniref:uncharacterized protein LOC135105256 n=1 Tax=Scylla paramamosain TaxID=85552 RepID=UPI003083B954
MMTRAALPLITAWAWVACVLVGVTWAPAQGEITDYLVKWCHCDLDECLKQVLTALQKNTTLPSCSPKEPAVVTKPGTEEGDSEGTNSEGNQASSTDTTTTLNTTTTTSWTETTYSTLTSGGGEGNTTPTISTTETTLLSGTNTPTTDTSTLSTASTTTDGSTTPASTVTGDTATTTAGTDATIATTQAATQDPDSTKRTARGKEVATTTVPGTTIQAAITTEVPSITLPSTTIEAAATTLEVTTTPLPNTNVRRKRSVGDDLNDSDEEQLISWYREEEEEEEEEGKDWPEDIDDAVLISRRRRSVESSDSGKVIVARPFRRIVKTVDDEGVMFDKDHNASTCSCGSGSRVSVELCIKDLKFDDSLANNKSDNYTYFSYIFIKELRKYMLELKDQSGMYVFRRMEMPTFTNGSGSSATQLNTMVDLTLIHKLAAYYVTMALDLNIGVTQRLAGYRTAIDNCLVVLGEC